MEALTLFKIVVKHFSYIVKYLQLNCIYFDIVLKLFYQLYARIV